MQTDIFSTIRNAKAVKALPYGFLNAIMYLAPADRSGINVCPHASEGCKAICLGWTSGFAVRYGGRIRNARVQRMLRFMRDRAAYMADVAKEIARLERRATKDGQRLCVRMNGSSDIAWEGIRCGEHRNVFAAFPHIAFVDYTKNPARFDRVLPHNCHLTFSRSETNEDTAVALLKRGINVAVVFAGQRPRLWRGFRVIDGDKHDLRHLDPRGPRGSVIALSPKGQIAKRDRTGFVVRGANQQARRSQVKHFALALALAL